MTDRVRLTISITPEVHAIFSEMAQASGLSLSRAIGDWLQDTAEGAQFVAAKMAEARRAPQKVMEELQGMAAGLSGGSADRVLSQIQAKAREASGRGPRLRGGASKPLVERAPSSNTGLKSPRSGSIRPLKASSKGSRT